MNTIKTKVHVEGIKVLDKASDLTTRAKSVYIRTKEAAEGTKPSHDSSPTEYATDSMQGVAQTAASKTASVISKSPKKTYNNVVRAKERFQDVRNRQRLESQRAMRVTPGKATSRSEFTVKPIGNMNDNGDRTGRGFSSTSRDVRAVTKEQIKATHRSVKTAARSGRQTIKTAQQTAKVAQKSAKAAEKAAKTAERAARTTAKTVRFFTKITVKAIVASVKAIIAATKALVSAIIAGGWVAVVIIVVVCMIAILMGSVFGIFFSGEASPDTGQTINSVIAEINREFTEQLDFIINSNPHDLLDMSGTMVSWKHVLAVYTVRTVTNPDNPMDVATMNDEKAQILRDVFWDMNTIYHSLADYDVEIDVLDEDGLPTGETYIETTVILVISVECKTITEISAQYGFNSEQREWLEELLKPEYQILWNALLFGNTSIGDGTLIEIAETQIGNIGGELYWRWYGFSNRVPWCACFVSWVANQAGFIDAGVIPRFSSCSVGIQWFRYRNQWQGRGYTPVSGDLIFFNWDLDGVADHVGIVERVEGGYVHTIEGNSSDSVRRRSYPLGSNRIFGYGLLLTRY